MDLSTTYLGLELEHPLIPGASPLVHDLDTVRQLEDAGAPALVMPSLYREQIEDEQLTERSTAGLAGGSEPASERYLEHLRCLKDAVDVPVVASLNGTTEGGWLSYAALLEEAGADALELNVYELATDPWESAREIEDRMVRMVRVLKEKIEIPLAVKLSPFFTSLSHFAQQLDDAGADGLVLFNRFYQPEIDVDQVELRHALRLSDSSELLLRLRWVAILTGEVDASIVVTGGVHSAVDVVKAIMCGADAVQLVSALFKHGPGYLAHLRRELANWMVRHEYESLHEMYASLSLETCPDPHAQERAHYIEILRGWWHSLLAV